MMVSRKTPITALGTASRIAAILGRNASPSSMIPIAKPTLRAATPVKLMSEMLDGE